MIDRLSIFSDHRIREIIIANFLPLTGNDWYQRRRQDQVGVFWRFVADQGPRKGEGGSTRQGHYIFTPAGKLLAYNNNHSVERRLAFLREGLKKWSELTPAEQKADLPELGKLDPRLHRALPQGGQVLKIHTRALPLELHSPKPNSPAPGNLAAIDHLWLQQKEITQLHTLLKNGSGPLPNWFAHRLARFHLIDNTRGEPPMWDNSEIKKATFTIKPDGAISGEFHLETADQKRGFTGTLTGQLSFATDHSLATFELLATGLHWGQGPYTRGARPGKSPLGIHLALTPAEKPADLIPPQAIRGEKAYWEPTP